MSLSSFRFEGLTLTVQDIERSLDFYGKKLGLTVEVNAAPNFAMIRIGDKTGGGTIGLLSNARAKSDGAVETTALQKRSIHVEFSTDDLDGLYKDLQSRGVEFHEPPHDEPWERSMTAFDPDGYAVEFAQGRRGHNGTG
jgi:catechol 2,3-dioxygenase-like lactoylglutathione lyase family enzyme